MKDLERSIIDGLRRGDEKAYKLAADRLLRSVYGFLLRLTRDQGAAEDLTQETFLAVWQGIDSYCGRSRFITWVFGIAYRQYLRQRSRSAPETLELDPTRDGSDMPDPCAVLEASDERRRVRNAVYSLPTIYREVVSLVYLNGLSYREAAEALEINVGTAKSRVNTALRLLRERMSVREEAERNEVREYETGSE